RQRLGACAHGGMSDRFTLSVDQVRRVAPRELDGRSSRRRTSPSWPTELAALLCSHPETTLSHGDRSIPVDLRLDFAQAGAELIDREAWHHPRDGVQAPSKSADVAYDLNQGRRRVFDDAQAHAFELAGQPRRPATLRIGLRTLDAEERAVLEIVACVHLLRDEPPSRHEHARALVDVEALMSVDDPMERSVSERQRRRHAFQRRPAVAPWPGDRAAV